MKKSQLSSSDYQIFLLKSLVWLCFAWVGFLLALAGFFYASIAWIFLIAGSIFLTKRAIAKRVIIVPTFEMVTASIAVVVYVLFFSFFATPTIFSGRDQGSLSDAAINLAQNHQLEFSNPTTAAFFKLHEPGRALNFPGFYYTASGQLITQFPLAYICWLALFFAVFGTVGFVIANAVLMAFFLISFYLLARLFVSAIPSAMTLLFAMTSFVFVWFEKYTLSENMALPLLWMTILFLMLFIYQQRKLHYFMFLIASFLLVFTRIEGIAFLIAGIIIIAMNSDARKYALDSIGSRILLPASVFIVVFIANAFKDINFYREIVKAIFPEIKTPQAKLLGGFDNTVLPQFYLGKVFLLYGMLGFFILGGIAIIAYLFRKDFRKLIPFFVILPTAIYLFDSYISSDHPWMLRRFMFSLLPAGIFYSGILLGNSWEQLKEMKKYSLLKFLPIILSLLLLTMNIPSLMRYAVYSENKGLLAQTQKIASGFSSQDLILIDRTATGNGWNMLSGPMSSLLGKNAVYFFNTQDLSKLDTSAFQNVYLIAPDDQVPFYQSSVIGKRLLPTDKYSLSFSELDIKQDTPLEGVIFPAIKDFEIKGQIFKVTK